MGTLRRADNDETSRELPVRCLLGRTPLARVRLSHRCASQEHAAMEWGGSHWRVRDLGSRNGTSVNGRACSSSWHELVAGDRLCFGGDEETWVLTDASAPPPAAIGEGGALRLGDGDLLTLPDGEEPVVSLYAVDDVWMLDDGERLEPVESGAQIDVGGAAWELLLPSASSLDSTLTQRSALQLDALAATFEFDRTEEHVRIRLESGASTIALPERSYGYLLMLLARMRLHDQVVRGLSDAEAGWIDSTSLAAQLKVRPEKMNVDIFRARKLFAEHQVVDAARVVERRPHTQQLRFGIGDIRFHQL